MTRCLFAMCLATLTGALLAQERIPSEEALRIARVLTEHSAKLDKLPLKVDVDADKAFALRKGEVAAMVIPDKKLSDDALAKTGKELTPLGQLWFRKLTPFVDSKRTPNDRLRIVAVSADGQDHSLPLFLLGMRKKAEDLELVVYAKDKEPLVVLPLRKVDSKQELPIEFAAEKGDNQTGLLTFTILGKYQAKLSVAEQE